jgi:Ser/Thr protein kinase RdoA (MazF antagonist)
MVLREILQAFALDENQFLISPITAGYINQTYKLTGENSFVLQRINKNVFTQPEVVASNIRQASDYIRQHHPEYLFLTSVKTVEGKDMVYDKDGFPWRLFPYIPNTVTFNKVETEEQAFTAAKGFALLTKNLSGCEIPLFKPTIDRFHDLTWRYEQFEEALHQSSFDRKLEATDAIELSQRFSFLVRQYQNLISSGALQRRIMHNDTKINNILFDSISGKAVCVIDLDTLMPGYFIYDLGDMVRTFVSPVDEEEKDLTKITVRRNILDALLKGYLSEMNDQLTVGERSAISFSGKMMTYIMALRMLADYLNGDVYYQTTYPKQNLIRARNQLRLLELLD